MTPDAPLVTFGDINRGAWPKTFGERPGTIFSYIMNNYWDMNYRAGQGGHFRFRYVMTSADATSASDFSRMGWEEATPFECDIVTSQDKAIDLHAAEASGNRPSAPNLDARQQSLLEIDDPNILLETWKPSEDGNGTILRFLDFGGTERTVTAKSPLLHLDHVWQTDALERGQSPVPTNGENGFHFTIHPHEIVTIRAVEKNRSEESDSKIASNRSHRK
jgi:alpha-mannosidase